MILAGTRIVPRVQNRDAPSVVGFVEADQTSTGQDITSDTTQDSHIPIRRQGWHPLLFG